MQSRVRIGQELESSCFSGKGLTSDVETSHTSHLSFHDVHTDGDGSHVSSPRLETRLPWQDPTDTKYRADGKAIPRRTIFSVAKGCNCTYKYSGVAVKPYVEPDWLAEIRENAWILQAWMSSPTLVTSTFTEMVMIKWVGTLMMSLFLKVSTMIFAF